MNKDIFSKAERINKAEQANIEQAERLNTAKEVFKSLADEYLKQETNINRLSMAANLLEALTKGTMALHTMERRGINFE